MKRFVYETMTSVGQVGVLLAGAVILRVAFEAPPVDAAGAIWGMSALGVFMIVFAAAIKAGMKNAK